MNKIIEMPTKVSVIIKNIFAILRARKKSMPRIDILLNDTSTSYRVMKGNNIIINHCPIIELDKDKRCIKTNCPFNSGTICDQHDAPNIYDDFRP